MPEIGEVARIVNRLNKHLVGKTIASIQAANDALIFKDTSADEFKRTLEGHTVLAAKQWGKYFWLVMDDSCRAHPLMHFGMTGWIYIKDDPMAHYRAEEKPEQNEWPPKYHKFIIKLRDSNNEIALCDSRRLARIRLIEHNGYDLRNVSPLKENGPDPVQEPITLEWFRTQLKARKVPIKSWLLDQARIAGIGNWVGDEILYHARLHPECYTNNLEESHVADLHKALLEVTKIAVETDADSSKFPDNWLMLHRWGKGKKAREENKLPSGEQVEFVTVGGRTSAYVPVLQKKVGPSAEERKPAKKTKRKNVKEDEEDGSTEEVVEVAKAPKKRQVKKETEEMTGVPEEDGAAKAPRKRRVKKEIEEQSNVLEVTKGAKAPKKRQGKKEVGQPSSALKDAIADIPAVQDEKSANAIESEAIRERKIEHKEHQGPVKTAKPEKDGDTRTSDFTGLRRSSRRK